MNRPDWLIIEPAETYHAKASENLSSHQLADFRKCPSLYWKKHSGLISDKDSAAYAFGRAAHTLILEGRDAFEREYAIGGPINPKTGKPFGSSTGAYASWLAESGKQAAVTGDESITLELMEQSVLTQHTPKPHHSLPAGSPKASSEPTTAARRARFAWTTTSLLLAWLI